MWIVELALRRPYTFVVMALAIIVFGVVAIVRMPADIFPNIDIPVVAMIWSYGGISPEEMADGITTRVERNATTTINDIEHMESASLTGYSIIKIFLHPSGSADAAVAEANASASAVIRVLPPGTQPPSVTQYNAASVPILQLGLSSDTMSEQAEYDLGYQVIRTQLSNIQGSSLPSPYGGRLRQIMVDINPQALYSRGLSPNDVSNALNAQSLVLPTGTAKIGTREYAVHLNNTPMVVEAFNRLPVKTIGGSVVYMRDIAQVRDGYAVQTNIVRHNGRRGALLTVLKNGKASTTDVVRRIKATLPRVEATLPAALKISTLFDQSIFVRSAISGVIKEALLAAFLTGLMILLFLGSWRSTLIVCISIPLSILTSLAILYVLGQTINIMTLGGFALAVGILVDDATVEIENIHRNLANIPRIVPAILEGARQIALPAFLSTLCICIVFVPVIFLTGTARFLFTPLALAVALAMAASYLLSRTLVPTMINYLIPAELRQYKVGRDGHLTGGRPSFLRSLHQGFEKGFERFRDLYCDLLSSALAHRKLMVICFVLASAGCLALYPFVGTDFFPQVDAGQIRLHVRCSPGTRIEETERTFSLVEDEIRRIIPREEISDILDNIGLPYFGLNIALSDSATLGSFDGEILISLKPGHHSSWGYLREMRKRLPHQFPDVTFFAQPADIVGQILNFGLPAPVDIQVVGPPRNAPANYALAEEISRRLTKIPGAVDVHVHQVNDMPMMNINVDRARASEMGLTQKDVANSALIALSSSGTISPNWWVNPESATDYLVAVQTPAYNVDSTQTVLNTPLNSSSGGTPQLLGNVAQMERGTTPAVIDHYNVQPLFDVYANVQDRDLGSMASAVDAVLAQVKPQLPKGSFFEVRGQIETMRSSFAGMGIGLIFSVLLVYFVMVVNFQSWTDPFIILMAVPGALAGIMLMLFFSRTTISVPALMGAIMSIGVGTANSILLVTFANDQRRDGADALKAAFEAGRIRLRPVLMTALAMLVGMLPMALGLGEGGEQNAPLGRAVIGGLAMATVATLLIVPVVYSFLRISPPRSFDRPERTG